MKPEEKIELSRRILNNAVSMHLSKEIIEKISQKLDEYIVEYYQQEENKEKDT